MNGERQGDLMVSALDSGASSPARALAGDIVLCSWARHCTLTMPLSTQVYRWVPKSCVGVTCDGLASRLGEVEILLAASCYRNRDKLRQLWASLGSKASLYDWCLQCDFTTRRRRNSQNVCLQSSSPAETSDSVMCLFGTFPGLWGRQVISYKEGYLLRNGSLYTLKLLSMVKFQR